MTVSAPSPPRDDARGRALAAPAASLGTVAGALVVAIDVRAP